MGDNSLSSHLGGIPKSGSGVGSKSYAVAASNQSYLNQGSRKNDGPSNPGFRSSKIYDHAHHHHHRSHSHYQSRGHGPRQSTRFMSTANGLRSHLSSGSSGHDMAYNEAGHLKRTFGPVLVAALNEICIRRPTDPIEYLGHWLLRYQFNKELKQRDIENVLGIIKQKENEDEIKSESDLGPESRGSGEFVGEEAYPYKSPMIKETEMLGEGYEKQQFVRSYKYEGEYFGEGGGFTSEEENSSFVVEEYPSLSEDETPIVIPIAENEVPQIIVEETGTDDTYISTQVTEDDNALKRIINQSQEILDINPTESDPFIPTDESLY